MILALMTSQYGDVYFRAIDSSACRSSLERCISNGLLRGTSGGQHLMPAYQITSPIRTLEYVIVFPNGSTKLDHGQQGQGPALQKEGGATQNQRALLIFYMQSD